MKPLHRAWSSRSCQSGRQKKATSHTEKLTRPPKCQASAAQRWLEARQADLLPVPYYHVVFTLPAAISAFACTNKAVIYGLLFDPAAETLRTIAAASRHLGAQIGVTLVLYTWGSALTHRLHVRGTVPGSGSSALNWPASAGLQEDRGSRSA
jgi:hypothetical protein